MVDMGTALIVGSIISTAGFFLMIERNNINWFKRENFKVQIGNVKAENRIKIKKLERELGLAQSKEPTESGGMLGNVSELLSIAKGLDPEQIGALVDAVTGLSAGENSELGGLSTILESIPPDVIKSVLGGLNSGSKAKDTLTGDFGQV